jgi:hypothetical protein
MEMTQQEFTEKILGFVNDGISIAFTQISKDLSIFIEKKVEKGLPAYITKEELDVFMKTYINAHKALIYDKMKGLHDDSPKAN